jgi:hypothetical protein
MGALVFAAAAGTGLPASRTARSATASPSTWKTTPRWPTCCRAGRRTSSTPTSRSPPSCWRSSPPRTRSSPRCGRVARRRPGGPSRCWPPRPAGPRGWAAHLAVAAAGSALPAAVAVLAVGWLPRAAAVIAWVGVGYCAVIALFADSFNIPEWAQPDCAAATSDTDPAVSRLAASPGDSRPGFQLEPAAAGHGHFSGW